MDANQENGAISRRSATDAVFRREGRRLCRSLKVTRPLLAEVGPAICPLPSMTRAFARMASRSPVIGIAPLECIRRTCP
jgi:hypothetical protein